MIQSKCFKIGFSLVVLLSIQSVNSFACERYFGYVTGDYIECEITTAAELVVGTVAVVGGWKATSNSANEDTLVEMEKKHAKILTEEHFLKNNPAINKDGVLQEMLGDARGKLAEIESKVHNISSERAQVLRKARLGQLVGALFALPLAKQIYDAGIGGKSLAETPEAELYGEGRGISSASTARAE